MLRWRGDQAAQAAIRQGENSAQLWGDVGNIIGQTAQTISRERAERPQREREQREQERADKLQTVLSEVGSLPPEQAIQRVRAAGFAAEANTLQKQYDDQVLNRLQRENTTLDLASKRISQARTMFEEINAAPEEERPAIYQQIAPRVRELVGPELGSRVKDEYDPQFVERAMTWGMSTVEKLNTRRAAIGLVTEDTKNADERDDKARQALIQYLPTVDTQEELDQALSMAKARGARPETLALFPSKYSPEAMAQVNEIGLTPEQRAKREEGAAPESERAFIERAAREQGRPVASFNNNEIGRLKAQFASLSRAPKDDGGITQAQRMAAERWKQNELQQAEDDFRKATAPYTIDPDSKLPIAQPMALPQDLIDQHEARKRRIQLSYLEQIGDTSTGRPTALPNPPAAPTPPPVRAAAEPPPSAPVAPAAPLGAAPANAASPYTVGQVVSVRGQRVRITKINPDGSFEGERVP
jgi:hypothetical protein